MKSETTIWYFVTINLRVKRVYIQKKKPEESQGEIKRDENVKK